MNLRAAVSLIAEGSGIDSSSTAVILSFAGVIITSLLTVLTAVLRNKDRQERNADRRKIEEETTDVILKRVRAELDRAYETIDIKDAQLHKYARFLAQNRVRFENLGIMVPDIDTDEGPSLYEKVQQVRVEIDRAAADDAVCAQRKDDDDDRQRAHDDDLQRKHDEAESDKLLDEDRRG